MLDRIKTILSGIGDGACATGVEWGFWILAMVMILGVVMVTVGFVNEHYEVRRRD